MPPFVVFVVGRSGSWPEEIYSNTDPAATLKFLREARAAHPFKTTGRVHGVWDDNSPEVGDVEHRLEALVEEQSDMGEDGE